MTGTAIVTGGSRGLGSITVRHLAGAGWRVGCISRNYPSPESTVRDVAYVSGDVSDYQSMSSCANATLSQVGAAQLVICNAAIVGPIGRLHETESAEFSEALGVNVLGVVNTIKAYWSQLQRAHGARVIVVSGGGTGGPRPMLRVPAYVPSKAALINLVEILAPEFAEIGASIIAVAPGAVIPTDFLTSVNDTNPESAGEQLINEAATQRAAAVSAADGYLHLVDYLSGEAGLHLNGVTLSGKWNTPTQLDAVLRNRLSANMYRLRRIDGELFDER